MKEIFAQLAAYNLWANDLVINALSTLEPEAWQQPMGGSFDTVQDTLLHIWNAESIWWQRMKLQETIQPPAAGNPGPEAIMAGLKEQSARWKDWVAGASEAALRHEFIYQNNRRETFKNPIHEMLTHIFNHGTYHRGQLINYLRQLKMDAPPATDFIAFTRKK